MFWGPLPCRAGENVVAAKGGEGVGPRVCCVFLIRMDADGDDQQRGTSCGRRITGASPWARGEAEGLPATGANLRSLSRLLEPLSLLHHFQQKPEGRHQLRTRMREEVLKNEGKKRL